MIESTPLEPAEQKRLFLLMGDPDADAGERARARDALISANARLVPFVLDPLRFPPHVDRDDIYGYGHLALIRAVDRFRPELGFLFSTYAHAVIRRLVWRYVIDHENLIRVPVYLMATSPESAPDREKRADRDRDAAAALRCGLRGDAWVLDRAVYDDPPDESARTAAKVAAVLAALPRREASLLRRRYGIGCEPETITEISRRDHVSKQRIAQLCFRAARRTRKAFCA